MQSYVATILTAIFIFYIPGLAAAQSLKPSSSFMGSLGLNTIPSARMDTTGTARATISTLDPYVNFNLGFQVAKPLFVNIRQSLEVSDINEEPDRLYPGVDLKLRLHEETGHAPAVAIGIQSAIGHTRMAGEYIALSKRYKSFDFTGGIAWGRTGSAGQIDNPLRFLNSHFENERGFDGEMPVRPADWFTGEKAGIFAGVEYATPVDGLSLKLDWGADRYAAERAAFDFNAPSPWSFGFAYQPLSWLDIGGAIVGGDKLLGRLTVKQSVENWPGRPFRNDSAPSLRPFRTGLSVPAQVEISAHKDGLPLRNARRNTVAIAAEVEFQPEVPLPRQLGTATRHMANHAGERVEKLIVTPVWFGLRGPSTAVMRKDLERALIDEQGSAEELWNNAEFNTKLPDELKDAGIHHRSNELQEDWRFGLILDNQLSLAEEDSGLLYRTSLLADLKRRTPLLNLVSGMTWRLDLANNLDHLEDYRPSSSLPVRSNVQDFANTRVSPDRLYTGWLRTIHEDLYAAFSFGYLEEMYAGTGGELLYRPYGKTFAIGVEAFQVAHRDPGTVFHMGLSGNTVLTGHANVWYEVPDTNLTLNLKAGRFLAGDIGAKLALSQEFSNGVNLEGFITATNQSDIDIFGGATHLYNGIRLTLPLGNLKPLPPSASTRIIIAPFGRDSGQELDKPLNLFELTKPFSHRSLARHWSGFLLK